MECKNCGEEMVESEEYLCDFCGAVVCDKCTPENDDTACPCCGRAVNDKEAGDESCDGCGEINGQCPLCCGLVYSCGSETCDFCRYSDECGSYYAEKI